MDEELLVKATAGRPFEDGDDRGRILVSSRSTQGAYSVMEWVVAPGNHDQADSCDFGVHQHGSIEETFLVRSGELEFLLGDTVTTVGAGDFVRVPPGVRHGYRNATGAQVDLVVTFVPGGFEELFVKYRTDRGPAEGPGFLAEATERFDSTFE